MRHYINISVQMAWAQIKRDAARNFAGFFWWVADPLIQLTLFYVIFTYVFTRSMENFLAFLFLNLVLWRWMSATIVTSAGSIVANAATIRQVYLPKFILPLKCLIFESCNFAVALVFVVAVLVLSQVPFSAVNLLYFPLLVLVTAAFVSSSATLAALITPYFPDLLPILRFTFRGLLFMSGVFYDPSRIPEQWRDLFFLNPFAAILEMFRAVLFRGEAPDPKHVLYIAALSVPLAALAYLLHYRVDRKIVRMLY